LKDPSKISASSSVFTLVGHKDDEIARPISERLSKELNQVAVVAAGVHVDRATEEDIRRLVSNSMQLAEDLIKELKSTFERSNRL
jgi:F420-0:gamma-glutamyl ligase-like protein